MDPLIEEEYIMEPDTETSGILFLNWFVFMSKAFSLEVIENWFHTFNLFEICFTKKWYIFL